MYPTAEVRWFGRGTVPPAVAAWFYEFECEPVAEALRVDYYLRQVGTDSVSVKVRQERVEIKQRYQSYGSVRFRQRIIGRVDLWRKWSFALAPDRISAATVGAPHWIPIEKRRSLHRYRVDEEGVVSIAEAEVPSQGCDLELTGVRVGEVDWWTVGLEVHGEETSLADTLILGARIAFGHNEPPLLTEADSSAYPAWLRRIEREASR